MIWSVIVRIVRILLPIQILVCVVWAAVDVALLLWGGLSPETQKLMQIDAMVRLGWAMLWFPVWIRFVRAKRN